MSRARRCRGNKQTKMIYSRTDVDLVGAGRGMRAGMGVVLQQILATAGRVRGSRAG